MSSRTFLRKQFPTLRADFKRLTTDKAQRDSFRAHIINAVKQQLAPSMVNDKFQPGDPITPSGLLDEPEGGRPEDALGLEEEFRALKEADIDIDITDDDQVPGDPSKKVPVEDDDTPSEQEEFASGLEDMDETAGTWPIHHLEKFLNTSSTHTIHLRTWMIRKSLLII
jgi:hypothetical protein